jgi:large subunit ribosomal protein L24
MKIHKGDTVEVLTGKNRGKRGTVMRAFPQEGKVIVDGANMVKRNSKPRGMTQQGGIIDKDMPLPVSAVGIICTSCARPSRIGYTVDETGRKIRICRRCGSEL